MLSRSLASYLWIITALLKLLYSLLPSFRSFELSSSVNPEFAEPERADSLELRFKSRLEAFAMDNRAKFSISSES